MLVKNIMLKNIIKLYEDEYVWEAITKLEKLNLLYYPVLNNMNYPVGTFDMNAGEYNLNINKKIKLRDIMKPIKDNEIVKEFEEINMIFNKSSEIFFVVDDHGKFISLLKKRHVMKRYFEKLEYMHANLNGILESVDTAVLSINRQGGIVFINNYAMELLGILGGNSQGIEIGSVLNDKDFTKEIFDSEKEFSKSFDFNGKTLIFSRKIIENKNGIIGAICSLRNITAKNKINDELEVEKNETEALKSIFETAYDGLIVIDANGYITMISDAYKSFLGVENENLIGRHVTEMIENTRLHIVAKTGIPEVAELQKIKDNYIVASRIPVFKNGKVTSVVGRIMFKNIDELNKLYKKIGKIEQQLENYKDELSKINKAKYNFSDIVGKSSEIKYVKNLAKKAAYTDSNVLILGESGTGKELFAHSIHNSSARRNKPFIKVNCAAIPSELMESELFGYEQGAFTGAKKVGKIGKFQVADQGTIFLDEIGDMPMHMQAKLLRVIQEREIERIGSNKTIKIDVRIIAATNRNIEQRIEEKKFRLDLYYRLNVVTIEVPSLRERTEDINLLCRDFLKKYRARYLKKVDSISESAIVKLKKYTWPGNVRELENIIERAINILDMDSIIRAEHLPVDGPKIYDINDIKPLKDIVYETEKKAIIQCLEVVNFNKSKAARILGVSRAAFYEKLDKYNIIITGKNINTSD